MSRNETMFLISLKRTLEPNFFFYSIMFEYTRYIGVRSVLFNSLLIKMYLQIRCCPPNSEQMYCIFLCNTHRILP